MTSGQPPRPADQDATGLVPGGRRAPGHVSASADICLPRYGADTLSDLLPSIAGALGVPDITGPLGLAETRRACVFLVDGLGARLIRDNAEQAPYLAALLDRSGDDQGPVGRGRVLCAGFPATTVTSLASLGTGQPPGRHGMLGYRVAVPGSDQLMCALRWDADVDPLVWQPCPTMLQRIAETDVAVIQVNSPRFVGTGLTTAALRGGRYVPAESAEDRVREALAALASADRSLVYAYYADLDLAGHTLGVDSDEWREQLGRVDSLVRQLAERLPPGATLYVAADHGMVDVPSSRRIDIDQDPELRAGVARLGGEGRARYLYAHRGAARDVLAIWRERLAGRALVRSRDQAIEQGWFGPEVSEPMAERIGDVVVALRDDWAVTASRREAVESRLVGMHGSLTAREQQVPLLEVRAAT